MSELSTGVAVSPVHLYVTAEPCQPVAQVARQVAQHRREDFRPTLSRRRRVNLLGQSMLSHRVILSRLRISQQSFPWKAFAEWFPEPLP